MPCRDDYLDVPSKADLDRLTNLLCSACKVVDERQLPAEVKDWWAAHTKADREREERERALRELVERKAQETKAQKRLRTQALKKLTKEERKALGY